MTAKHVNSAIRQRGFSLIETVVALGIWGAMGMAFLTAMATGLGATNITDEQVTAESLAQAQLEDVKLLLSLWSAYAYDNDPSGQATVRTEVTEPSTIPTSVKVPLRPVGSSSQVIVLRTPTFQELRDFILRDPTSRNQFVLNQYECRNFATDVNNNAEAVGLRCAFVLLCFDRGQHAVVAFDTTDRGLVYIEPQTDAHIYPEVGGTYEGKKIKQILIAW